MAFNRNHSGLVVLILGFSALAPGQDEAPTASGENCTFRIAPDEFLGRAARERVIVSDKIKTLSRAMASGNKPAAAADIPRRNSIDVEIFDQIAKAGIPSAAITSDTEFLRRIYLDLTGRIPSPDTIRAFTADTNPNKRYDLIDSLLYSAEFSYRWKMWIGDWLANTINTTNINRSFQGRNAFNDYIDASIAADKPLKDMVYEVLTATGNSYDSVTGASNYIIAGRQQMGPVQDWYDLILFQAADKFLGLSNYDCLLCHNGRGHLDSINLWASARTRVEAEQMAAFFSRINFSINGAQNDPYNGSWTVSDRTSGNYALNTNYGNRPNRVAVGTVRSLDALYRDGTQPKSANWRVDFTENLVRDPMFSINIANRLWKAMFNYGLVEPVNTLDPARLDPNNPPPAPWTLQASHPQLLVALSKELVRRNYSLREFLRLLAESSAYQLSSQYPADWNVNLVPLYARHYPRRLEGEEVHDAIVTATGVLPKYTVQGWTDPVQWALQLPDPLEPRSNGGSLSFMNAFFRGNRDNVSRNQSGSILQELSLMNDPFVQTRDKVAASPVLQAISKITSDGDAVDQMYLTFLSRAPSDSERSQSLDLLSKANTAALRNAAIEDLAWALINKAEFIFSY